MKRILQTLSQKWPEYLLEILVLIVGIYGAFAVEAWGENKARRKEELEILKGCRTELMADAMEIDLNVSELQKSLRSIDIIIKALEEDHPYHDSLAAHFNYLFLPMHFVHSTSTFETLRSKGLDIVSNDSLRSQLINLYDSQYEFFIQGETEELDLVHFHLKYLLPSRFESSWNFDGKSVGSFEGEMVPLDFESLKYDDEFLHFIKTQRNRTRSYLDFWYFNLRKHVVAMIDAINVELTRIQS